MKFLNNKNMLQALLLSCLLTASASCQRDSFTPSEKEKTTTSGDISVLMTTNNRAYDLTKLYVDFSDKFNMSPNTIKLLPATQYQTMDGFGAAITGSTCYNLMKMNKEDRTQFLTQTFSESQGLGMSYIRISIGCSDFSLSEYTLWDTPGKENFALQEEEKNYVIPILKEILAINPNLKIMGSPWTAPRWMKVNNLTDLQPFSSWTSGQLNPQYYQDYGWYFVRWIEEMKKEGINIHSITIQNEPLNRGNSASMYMTWQEQQKFIKVALGPQLKAANLQTKIYAFDHNYNYDNIEDQKNYPINIYNDPAAAAYISGAAYHNYGGDKAELLNIHNQRPDKELVFTETSIGEWNEGHNLEKRLTDDMREVGLGTVNNWSKAVIVWNLMLDTEKGPNRDGGCQTCYGAVDINSKNYKSISRNSHYYVTSHLSSVVKPGAVRIGTEGYTATGLEYAAFKNPDNSYAMVLMNDANENRKITLSDGTKHFSYDVPSKSVVSFKWSN
ncbi:glucosylceramidase [Sphingobacterium alimentarium]|uniref:Glucosylceramidase n=2 Tax=Sphingobacterium alimentarium TaxID=797292 RepID=A0A4R3VSF0_9SPHI|nr:glucosylceramidase [Sphingobacterium alimentarium]